MAELNEGKFPHIVNNDSMKKPGRELSQCSISHKNEERKEEALIQKGTVVQ